MPTAYDELVAEFHDHFTADANQRVFKGIDERLGELPDPSFEANEASTARARRLLERIDAVREASGDALDFDQALDLDLAAWALEADVEQRTREFNGRHRLAQLPEAGRIIGDGIFMMLVNDPRDAAERFEDIAARLEAVPAHVAAMGERLEQPLQVWLEMERQRVEGLPELFGTVRAWVTSQVPGADVARLETAISSAESSLRDYLAHLDTLPTTTNLHVGPERAARIVQGRGVFASLDELHAIAREFLAESRELIEGLRAELARKYGHPADISTAALHEALNERFAVQVGPDDSLDAVLDRYREVHEEILAFIAERDLFPIFEGQSLEIMRTPGFMEPSVPAGAMLPPPAFREGVRTSLIYLTLHRDQLDDHTRLGIPMMMVHEGIPGHHLQLATGSIHPSTIRRHLEPMDQAEGWTTMLEDYMLDQGMLADLTDEARFVTRRDLSRIGARVAIDLFFMTGDRKYLDVGVDCDVSADDPLEAAISLLRAVTGFSRGRALGEVRWYSLERGYPLCYLAGNRAVWQLKREVIEAQRGTLEGLELDRRFHAVYLEAGNMPVASLRRVFEHRGLLPPGTA